MIRVVLRHIDDLEGAIVGDFPPSEIDALIDRLRSTPIYVNDHEDCKLIEDPLQWIFTDEQRQHAVLEIILEN